MSLGQIQNSENRKVPEIANIGPCRAKSTADFIYKMGIVEEEADESLYWMELLIEAKIMGSEKWDL